MRLGGCRLGKPEGPAEGQGRRLMHAGLGEEVLGREQIDGRAFGEDPAIGEKDYAGKKLGDEVHVMRDCEKGPSFLHEIPDEGDDEVHPLGVLAHRRLVQNESRCRHRQHSGNGHPPSLRQGEIMGIRPPHLAEPRAFQGLPHPFIQGCP